MRGGQGVGEIAAVTVRAKSDLLACHFPTFSQHI